MKNKITEESLLELTLKIPITILGDGERPKLAKLYLDMWNIFKCAYKNGDDVGHGEDHTYNVLRRGIDITIAMHGYKEILFMPNFNRRPDYFTGYLMLGLAVFTHDMYSGIDRERHHMHARNFIDKLAYINLSTGGNIESYNIENILTSRGHCMTILSIPNFKYKENIGYSLDWLTYFDTKDSLNLVAGAVLKHRASDNHEFVNALPEILSAADRDDLDVKAIVDRIYKCATDGSSIFNCDTIDGFNNFTITIDNITYESNKIIKQLNSKGWSSAEIKTYYHLWEKFSRNGYAFNKLNKDGIYMLYYKDKIEEFFKEVDEVIVNPDLILDYIFKLYKKEDKKDRENHKDT